MMSKDRSYQELEGKLEAGGKKYAIVVSRFNSNITELLLSGARECLKDHGATDSDIKIVNVPGAFELPSTASKLASTKNYDAIICLGVVIRGETPHFDYVCSVAADGISRVAENHQLPVIFGVLTTDNLEQAQKRSGTKGENKGWEASMAAIEMVNLFREIEKNG